MFCYMKLNQVTMKIMLHHDSTTWIQNIWILGAQHIDLK